MTSLVSRRRLIAAAALLGSGAARAQSAARYPDKPITLIVPFAPAGIADITARTVAQAMAKTLGQPIVVDTRPSAGSIVGSTAVAQAAPDGHTLLLVSNANAVSASLFKKLPFDIQKDFAPIGTLAFFDLAAFVDAGSRYKSVAELLADAKARPGKLTIGTISAGSTQHLSAVLFTRRAGIDAVVVPYKGTPAVMTALRAGEIDVAFEIVAPMLAQIAAKTVRALAVTSDVPHPALAGVPTMAKAGVANYNVASWNGLAAPKGTPPAVIARINQAVREALASPAVVQRFSELGVRAQAGSPAQLSALLASEIPRWREVIVAAKIEPE
jgi:tripartite-type tricarboxylate transporter receptor subunit TctC